MQSPETRGAPAPGLANPLVHDLVAAHARRTPDTVALVCEGAELAYGALDAWADRVAARLTALGVGRGDRVGVLAEQSAGMVAAVLGALRTGAAYVPVDPAQPDARVAALFADAEITAVLATPGTAPRVAGLPAPSVVVERGMDAPGDSDTAPRATASADDAAYLIYTSGSTGEPKGVVVEHGQLSASTAARRAVYPDGATFLLLSPLAFDSSVAGLWGALTAGDRLVIATAAQVRDPERLVHLIEEHSVTRLLCVPSLYDVLLDAAQRAGTHRLATLAEVIVAGEPLPQRLADRHFTVLAGHGTALVNEYGPTEATVWATYQRITEPAPVGIGGPIPGARVYVLDDVLQPVPEGSAGELYVGGDGVARGYFGRPEATERAFLPDPFADAAGARMYRTGDTVRRNAAGVLEFLGRRDRQVKIRGHRVELEAVETALRALPGVRDALVEPADGALLGFVLAPEGARPEALRAALAERLPEPMIPARILVLARFPRTVNGKVDRARLAEQAHREPWQRVPAAGSGAGPALGAAAGDLVPKVSAAWSDVLNVSDIPADMNYFELGGNSLTIFHLQDALEKRTGSRPSVMALFNHTTVAAQAALIGDGSADESLPDMRDAAARRARAVRARAARASAGAA